ncbi:hypothetical protein [Streptomyces sp. NPDC018972]|uniref:hypothetical protein n=1 Tax=Streptomyces sp. NPDC018972 TaxID=3365060 RepID=UPI00379563C9
MSSPTPSAHDAPFGNPAPAAPVRRGRSALVVALAAGLVLGAGGVAAAWALSGDDGSARGGAADDAHHACDALRGFGEPEHTAERTEREIALNRLAAAVSLSAAAAAGDREFKPLAEALRRVQNQYARFGDFNEPEAQKHLKTARSLCADI